MGLQYSPEDQRKVDAKVAAEIATADGDRREILRSIHQAVFDLGHFDDKRVTLAIARFGTLLVSLSHQADRVQRQMVWLTWSIAIMTLVLVGMTLVMLLKM